MNLLLFSGSLRKESLNKKLLAVAGELLSAMPDCSVKIVDLQPLQFPVYDGDLEAKGIPESVLGFGKQIAKCDALVISSPEYNGSIAGSFKNTIDWLSRLKPVPLEGKPVLLMGASPGAFGAMQGLAAGRMPFERLKAFLYPSPFALPKAHEAFTAEGELKDEKIKGRLQELLQDYVKFAQSLVS